MVTPYPETEPLFEDEDPDDINDLTRLRHDRRVDIRRPEECQNVLVSASTPS